MKEFLVIAGSSLSIFSQNKGDVFRSEGDLDKAIVAYKSSLKVNTDDYIMPNNIACLKEAESCFEFAKIQDVILVNTGKLQLYGMQFTYDENRNLIPFPIKDLEYVGERRVKIGLVPLKQYLKRKINYDFKVK